MPHKFSRRHLLGGIGATVGTLTLGSVTLRRAMAAGDKPPLVVQIAFNGGWDTLLTLDPRSHIDFADPDGFIYPAYDLAGSGDPGVLDALAATNGTGVFTDGALGMTFGPSMPASLRALASDICIVRGVDMGTLTHAVGKRYFLTGKFPRGLSANGSSLGTRVAYEGLAYDTGTPPAIPNLVVGMETYNEGLDASISGVALSKFEDIEDLVNALRPETLMAPNAAQAVEDYLDRVTCGELRADGNKRVTTFEASRPAAQVLSSGALWESFDLEGNPALVTGLLSHFGISDFSTLDAERKDAYGAAMIACQALASGTSHAASIEVMGGLDTHDETWQDEHSLKLRIGFEAVAGLISFLKNTPDGDGGGVLFDRTTVLVTSDFAREPKVNVRGGRDHHLASACLVAGMNIRGGAVIGGTTNDTFQSHRIDPRSGMPSESGMLIRPTDVHATVLEAMGLSWDHLANQDPALIPAMLNT